MEKFYNDFKTEEVVILGVNLTHTEESIANVPISLLIPDYLPNRVR